MSAEPAEEYLTPHQENLERWDEVLTQLEDNLVAFMDGTTVLDQARTVASAWHPPHELGPLPAELATRARLLSMAQQRAYAQLRSESRMIRQQAELIRSVPSASSGGAVYLDVAG
ncbi:hypothetical protein [Arthrobacter sp. Edens01]|uniref:hypothetical protein n=1 Tax=Arthrobacter sp. Edens01 TaxID=1732020 RepID=UPI0006DB54FB|nr:hypothetical protein [Arthrobacter sp. Edens01]KPN18248.1 hypothetical protein AO716_10280 [Arthrobacter sp. Edens01]